MTQLGFHHANHLASEIRSELRANQTQMLSLLQSFSDTNIQAENDTNANNNKLETVNAVTQTAVQFETLKVLQQLQNQL